jgi:hypothetical protein
MDNAISFKRGDFKVYYSKTKIRVGTNDKQVVIEDGQEFEYDGTTLKYDGLEFGASSLRGIFSRGWASPFPDDPQPPIHNSGNVERNIASAKVKTSDFSRVHRMSSDSMTSVRVEDQKVLDINRRTAVIASGERVSSENVQVVKNDPASGRVIARVKVPAKVVVNDMHLDSGENRRRIEEAGDGKPIYLDQKANGVSITTNTPSRMGARVIESDQEEGYQIIGQVAGRESRLETNVPVPLSFRPQKDEDSLKIAAGRLISPLFPKGWDFKLKLSDKIETVVAMKPNKALLQAFWLVESDAFRKSLLKSFPNVFLLNQTFDVPCRYRHGTSKCSNLYTRRNIRRPNEM